VIVPDRIAARRLWAVFCSARNGLLCWNELAPDHGRLACDSGDLLVDLRDKIPRGLNSIDLMVTVEPFYARFYIYQPGFPESLQHCWCNKPSSIIKVPVVDGRFCIRQSQPRMKWTVRALFRPDIQM
jgi:hypothetical protein